MNVFSRDRFTDGGGGLRGRIAGLPPWVRRGAPVIAVLAIAFLGWLGVEVVGAKSSLEQARNNAQQAKDALLAGNSGDATRWAENAQSNAREAQAATHSLPWNIAAAVPLLGSPLKTTQQMSDVVVGLADTVLVPGAQMGAGISPDKLVDGTRIDLNLLRSEEPRLSELSAAAAKLDAQAQAISRPAYFSLIGNARTQLQDQTAKLASLLGNTAIAAKLAPSMLGADGPRRYLMAFETPVEARGTGGILGAFGIIRFEDGKPIIETISSNGSLRRTLAAEDNAVADIDLGPEFNKVYGWMNPYSDLRNSNVSPHFPYAARIWKSMWENSMLGRESGKTLQGVISMDIVALSYLLGALGPVTMPDGEVVTQENIVELTGSTVYLRYPEEKDQAVRKEYLQTIAKAILQEATGAVVSPQKLLDAIGRAAGEGRISVWSSSPAVQTLLERTPLAHIIPGDSAPYVQAVVNNLAGNKMDYYLEREIEYTADACDGEMRNSTITLRLTNTASEDTLPGFYAGSHGLPPGFPVRFPNGSMVSSVRVIATQGAKLMSVTSNGKKTVAITHVENGHPSFEVQVVIPPGESGELTFRLTEPTASGEARVPIQPLVDEVTPKIVVPVCQ